MLCKSNITGGKNAGGESEQRQAWGGLTILDCCVIGLGLFKHAMEKLEALFNGLAPYIPVISGFQQLASDCEHSLFRHLVVSIPVHCNKH